jgi:hypothetical protein
MSLLNHRKVLFTSGTTTAAALAGGGIALAYRTNALRRGTARAVFLSAGSGTSTRSPAGTGHPANAFVGFAQPDLVRAACPAATGTSTGPAADLSCN